MKTWQGIVVAISGALVLISATAGVIGYVQSQDAVTRVTRVERQPTPCLVDARSRKCAHDARRILLGCLHDSRCLAITQRFAKGGGSSSGSPPPSPPGGGPPRPNPPPPNPPPPPTPPPPAPPVSVCVRNPLLPVCVNADLP